MSELRRPQAPEGARQALQAALAAAGKVILRRYLKTGYRLKGRSNLVTLADLESQRTILSLLSRRFARHRFIAEEGKTRIGSKRRSADFTWVIDPLDGTTNYAHGFPMSVVSIGLLAGETPVLGGIHDPFRKETFLAERGGGATLNGRRIGVSRTSRLGSALLVTGFPYDRAERADFYVGFYKRFLSLTHDIRRTGAAALDLAWVAAGRVDAFWEFKLSPWDVAAGRLLVEEAGGRVTDFRGRPWKGLKTWGGETLATNGLLHPAMLRVLRPVR